MNPIRPHWRQLKHPVHLLAFGFGSGLAPKAPGTFGTLAGVPLYLLLVQFSVGVYLAVLLLAILLGIYICGASARSLGVHDHPAIVWDEICGLLVAMLGMPPGWVWLLCGFALFRFFDIVKPWPIRYFDRNLHGGLGIMLDDLLAGIAALAIGQGLQLWVL